MKKTALLLLTLQLAVSGASGAFKDPGFLARPIGMGGAFTAIADDINSVWYNPAGIVNVERNSVMFTYSKPYLELGGVDMNTSFGSYVMPLKKSGAAAVTFTQFNTADLYTENTGMLSYAYKFDFMKAGINLKYLGRSVTLDKRTIDDPVFAQGTSKSAFTADIGVLRKWNENVFSGICVKNVTAPDVGFLDVDQVPMEMRVGTAGSLKMVKPAEEMLISCDLVMRDKDFNACLGSEMWFYDYTLAGRLGFNKNEASLGVSYVYNIAYSNFSIETHYSFTFPFYVEGSSGSHRLSLGFQF
jgi:hypothetical protein